MFMRLFIWRMAICQQNKVYKRTLINHVPTTLLLLYCMYMYINFFEIKLRTYYFSVFLFISMHFTKISSISFRLANFIIQFSHNYDAIRYVLYYFSHRRYLEMNFIVCCVCHICHAHVEISHQMIASVLYGY